MKPEIGSKWRLSEKHSCAFAGRFEGQVLTVVEHSAIQPTVRIEGAGGESDWFNIDRFGTDFVPAKESKATPPAIGSKWRVNDQSPLATGAKKWVGKVLTVTGAAGYRVQLEVDGKGDDVHESHFGDLLVSSGEWALWSLGTLGVTYWMAEHEMVQDARRAKRFPSEANAIAYRDKWKLGTFWMPVRVDAFAALNGDGGGSKEPSAPINLSGAAIPVVSVQKQIDALRAVAEELGLVDDGEDLFGALTAKLPSRIAESVRPASAHTLADAKGEIHALKNEKAHLEAALAWARDDVRARDQTIKLLREQLRETKARRR